MQTHKRSESRVLMANYYTQSEAVQAHTNSIKY